MAKAAYVLVDALASGGRVCSTTSKVRSSGNRWHVLRRLQAVGLAIVVLTVLPGCVGVFASPRGPSLSWGSHAHGALLGAVALPMEGAGYRVHPEWRARGRTFAIEELIAGLTRAFARVEQATPGSVAYVGDLSLRRGGDSSMHRSHESGRDVDIFYYAADRDGNPLPNLPAMIRFADDGSAAAWSSGKAGRRIREPLPDAHLDLRRTWALVANLLSDPMVEAQWIFIHRPLAELLLQEAEQEKADPALLARAREILHQPTDARPHDDHMHLRVFCPAQSRLFGCADKGPRRWLKKRWKYMSPTT
jgi:penicillin-insensitive murein endopeptidase